jgi:hypothetical protein
MSELAAICDGCHSHVAPGAGYLGVRHSEITAYQAAEKAWSERYPGDTHTIGELTEMPDGVLWHVWHFRCDPHPEEDGYQIGVEDLRTWTRLAWWTAHLMSKSWLPLTDWDGLLRDVADRRGRRIVVIPAANAA